MPDSDKYNPNNVSALGSFKDLPQAVDPSVAMNPEIPPDELAFSEEEMSDDVALGIVLTDVQSSVNYLQSKSLVPVGIDLADDVVRGYVKPRTWPDGKPKSSLPMYVCLEAIEKILPVLYMSLFGSGKKMPFIVEPMGNTTPEAARAKGSVLYWAMKQAGLKESIRLTLKNALTYGFCAGWTGWESKSIRKKVYTRNASGGVSGSWKEVPMNLPTYENVNLKNFLFDPRCDTQNVHDSADWVAKQVMINANDLAVMREDKEHYQNIPEDDQLAFILSHRDEPTEDSLAANKRAVWREYQAALDTEPGSKDPLFQPLEYIEYWTRDRVIGVLQRKIVIRNQENEKRELPARSCAFVDILGSAWGFGIARLLSSEQRLQTGVACNWVDSLALVLNPMYQTLKGMGVGQQNIQVSPGKVINEATELKALVTPDITSPAMIAITSSEDRAAKRVAANGGANLPNQALRTGAGVQALTGDVVQRLQYFLEIFIDNIFIPVLQEFLEDCFDHLTPEQLNVILTEEEGKAWQGDVMDIYNAQCDVDVLAGANMMAKFAAAQVIPLFLQTLAAGPVQDALEVQGKYADFAELVQDTAEWMGLNVNSYFHPMTDEMKKARDAKNAAVQKGQANLALQQQKHADDMQLENEKGTVQAGVGIVRDAAKGHMQVAQNALESLNQGSGDTPNE